MTRRIRLFAFALLAAVALGASACADATAPDFCETGTQGSGTCNGTGTQGSGT